MNDEIKEILDNFEKYEARYKLHNETQFIITHREIQILLDYITNLQQENERLNNCIDDQERVINSLIDKMDLYKISYNDYKSRCEKVIEYIDKQKKKMYKSRNKIALFVLMKLEYILQNGRQ